MAIAVGYSDISKEKAFPDYLSPTGGQRSEKRCNFSGLEGGGERKKYGEKHLYDADLQGKEGTWYFGLIHIIMYSIKGFVAL